MRMYKRGSGSSLPQSFDSVYTKLQLKSLDELYKQILTVRATSIAIERGETHPDISCISTPLFHNGKPSCFHQCQRTNFSFHTRKADANRTDSSFCQTTFWKNFWNRMNGSFNITTLQNSKNCCRPSFTKTTFFQRWSAAYQSKYQPYKMND